MFNNLFKKFGKNGSAAAEGQNGSAAGGRVASNGSTGMVRPMGQHLQKKFARGIQYNSKLLLFQFVYLFRI